jgi:hypothetical protein
MEEMQIRNMNKFTSPEDKKLMMLVEQIGTQDWKIIAKFFSKRTPRQLRERYKFYLDPNLNKNSWSTEEDQVLLQGYRTFGSSWKKISQLWLPNRTIIGTRNRFLQIQKEKEKRKEAKFDFFRFQI